MKLSSKDMSYNKNLYLRESHNCYNYFLNKKSINAIKTCKNIDYKSEGSCRRPQPGYAAGMKVMTTKDYTCKTIKNRTQRDNPSILDATENETCKKGYYKGALVVAPKRDFHYYRLNDDGVWSHKPGGTRTSVVDSNGKPIVNPRLAGRKYGKKGALNYTDFCSYFCVPKDSRKKNMMMYKDVPHDEHQATTNEHIRYKSPRNMSPNNYYVYSPPNNNNKNTTKNKNTKKNTTKQSINNLKRSINNLKKTIKQTKNPLLKIH
jgi:hypothetical protein